MKFAFQPAACTAGLAILAALPLGAAAAQQNTFTGVWAPTEANGYVLYTGEPGLAVSVSADGRVLTAELTGGTSGLSFFLETYGTMDVPPVPLPQGPVSYDYAITYTTAGDYGVATYDDFGNRAEVRSGDVLSGRRSFNYAGGYFGYFGVNITGWDSELGEVPANATVVLSNFSAPAPVPEPGAWALALAGLGVLALRRRQG